MNDGGPAFPNIGLVEGITCPFKISDEARTSGLSLRDYFAAMPLSEKELDDLKWAYYATHQASITIQQLRYWNADQMLKARV